eukprot:m.149789 g.149789  ORF g.149789 m.149789 type:complete len:644 (+) comp14208_c0_seq1:73-2004(+)
MGLLGRVAQRLAIERVLVRRSGTICSLLIVMGLVGLTAISTPQLPQSVADVFAGGDAYAFVQHLHTQENGLLPGSAKSEFSQATLRSIAKATLESPNLCHVDQVARQLRELSDIYGQFEVHSHSVSNSSTQQSVFGILRSRVSGSSTAVLHAAIDCADVGTNALFGMIPTLAKQNYWAKDVVFLFTSNGFKGTTDWLADVFDGALKPELGRIEAALSLSLPTSHQTKVGGIEVPYPKVSATKKRLLDSSVQLDLVGFNGQLPNMDLVMTALHTQSTRVLLPYQTLPTQPVWALHSTFIRWLTAEATCKSSNIHGPFLKLSVPAYTITVPQVAEGYRAVPTPTHVAAAVRVLECVLRSVNNLSQRFNLSFTYYVILSAQRFVSIGRFLPPVGLILLAATLSAVARWLSIVQPANSASMDSDHSSQVSPSDSNHKTALSMSTEQVAALREPIFGAVAVVGVAVVTSLAVSQIAHLLIEYSGGSDPGSVLLFFSVAWLAVIYTFSALFLRRKPAIATVYISVVADLMLAAVCFAFGTVNFGLGAALAVGWLAPLVLVQEVVGTFKHTTSMVKTSVQHASSWAKKVAAWILLPAIVGLVASVAQCDTISSSLLYSMEHSTHLWPVFAGVCIPSAALTALSLGNVLSS